MDRNEETTGQDAAQNADRLEETNENPMEALLEEESYELNLPRSGELRSGTIARIADTDILVDIGYKSEGLIASKELEQLPQEKREELIVGKEVMVYVIYVNEREGTILLSLSRAEEEQDWQQAERLAKTKEVYEGVVAGYNKGGLIIKFGSLRGFVPASQVSIARRWRANGDSLDQRWGMMVGEPIVAKVIEVDRKRSRLILSEKAAAREAREFMKEHLISELEPGEIRIGHVISLADFGAFVDIGGADGLVHMSEISWKRISHPREVLKVGQKVNVKVLEVDQENKRISLSMRELEEDPWDTITKQLKEGQLVEGTITKLTKFGAFAALKGFAEYELEGLIHISELSDRHIIHPREVVNIDETVTLRVIRIDRERKRIGLSLKRVDSPEYAELDWQTAMEDLRTAENEVGEGSLEVKSEVGQDEHSELPVSVMEEEISPAGEMGDEVIQEDADELTQMEESLSLQGMEIDASQTVDVSADEAKESPESRVMDEESLGGKPTAEMEANDVEQGVAEDVPGLEVEMESPAEDGNHPEESTK